MKKMNQKKRAALRVAFALVCIMACNWFIREWATHIFSAEIAKIEMGEPSSSAQKAFTDASMTAFYWSIFVATIFMCWAFWALFREVQRREAAEKGLREAREQAEKTARARGELLSNVSHEIRSPLSAVLGFFQILNQNALESRQKEALEGSRMAAENLLRLANDLLDLSKMEAGKLAIEPRPFDLQTDVLKNLERVFVAKTAEKKISFKIETAPDTPDLLLGDPVRLTQILTNLLENAVKFTNRGYVFLLVEGFRMLDAGQSELHFIIKDTGDGIPADRLGRIFDRFVQVGERERSVGAGLGLAIVHDLAEALGGSVAVESHVGFGTTFSVRLPFRCGKTALALEAEKGEPSGLFLLDKKILLAEDEPLSQKLGAMQLENWGATVVTASDGAAAVDLLRQRPDFFDFVLMDVTMPEMDGWAATAKIRTELKNAVPIIALTGWAQAGEREKCLSIGMDGYLLKPLRTAAFLTEMQPFLLENEAKMPVLAAAENEKILNLGYLIDLSKGKKTFVREMLDLFGRQAPKELEALRRAVEARDFEKIRTLAHNLKSTAAYVGVTPEGLAVLEKMERLGSEKDRAKPLRTAFLEVEKLIEKAKKEAATAEF